MITLAVILIALAIVLFIVMTGSVLLLDPIIAILALAGIFMLISKIGNRK